MNHSRRFIARTKMRVRPPFVFTVSLILCALVLAGFGASRVYAQGPSSQTIWLQDPHALPVTFDSPAVGAPTRVASAFATSQVQPLTLANGRFYEEDGIEGLAVGYATSTGGAVAIYRGNLDAFAPQSEESFLAIGQGRFPAPFLPSARLFELPQRPDFLAAGNFTGGDHNDIVAATKGSSALYILANDGQGNFTAYPAFTLPGTVTALGTAKFDSPIAESIIVAVHRPQGPALLVYDTSADGLFLKAAYPLPAPATAVAVGNLDEDATPDVAVIAGGSLSILHGRNLTPAGNIAERLESVPLPFSSVAIALGSFIFDRDSRSQLALLASDGSLNIVVRNGFDPTPWTLEEISARRQRMRNGERDAYVEQQTTYRPDTWKVIESVPAVAASGNTDLKPVLMSTHISDRGADDVMVLDSAAGQMTVVAHQFHSVEDNTLPAGLFPTAERISRAYTPSSTIAAVPMRINVDGRPGIISVHEGQLAPSAMMPTPDPTFFPNRFDDIAPRGTGVTCLNTTAVDGSNDCTLREALIKANATVGTDTIQLQVGTYQLSLPKLANDYSSAHGALYVNDSVNIIGMGQNSTIIQAGTTNANGVDMVMAVNEDINPITNATASISNLTLKFGRNTGTHGNDGDGGCMEFDTGSSGNANLNLTNVTLTDCSTTFGNGAGIASFNFTSPLNGLPTFINSIIQNNSAVDATAGVGAGGGGIWVSQDSRASLTNTQVLNNKATQVNGTGKGIGGGIFTFTNTPNSRQTVIHGSTISGNKSAGFGGGIFNSVNLLVDQGTVISGNTAGTDGTNPIAGQLGGGLYDNTSSNGCPGACTDTATLSKVTITGNTASASGGGIYHGNLTGAGSLTMNFSRLAGNTSTPATSSNLFEDHSVATVTNNWWGTNAVATTITNSVGTVSFDPFIVLTHNATPAIIRINQSTTLTGDMSKDNHGNGAALTGNLNQIIGLPITFDTPVLGTIPQAQPETLNASAQATATFNAGGTSGRGSAHATVDQAVISANSNLIASAAEAATTVTITTVGTHNFAAGETVVISGVAVGGYNGTFAITATPTPTTFTYTTTAGLASPSSGGLANVGIIILEPLQITKSFSPTTVAINAPSTLTFNVTNPNIIAVDASFTDTFPANLQVANPPTVTNTCAGTFTPLAGDTSVTFNNAALAIGSCTITVHVIGTVDNIYSNSVTINSVAAGTGNTSSANLTVINPPHIVKAFGAATIPLNGTTSLTFTIDSNSNQNLTLTGVAFTDNLPAGLIVATPGNPTTNCPGGTVTAADGSSSVSLSGASLAPTTSCTVSVTVQGTTGGVKNNSVQVTSTNGGTGNTANASITVVVPPTISKAFGAASIPLNGTTTLTFTVTNPNTTVALTGIAFSDTVPANLKMIGFGSAGDTCNGTTSPGSSTVNYSAITLAANSSCTLTVTVKGIAAGDAVNTTSAITSTEGGTGTTSNTAVLTVVAPPVIAKAFNPTSIPLNGTTTLTFTITNPAANTVAETGVAFTDTLPTGLVVATPNGLSNTCNGTATAVAGSTSITLTGGSIAVNTSCTVVVNVTGTTAGQYTNTTGNVTSTNGGTGNTATANLSVVAPPTITKSFNPISIALNSNSTLSFTITNPNTFSALSGVAFTDNLPAGVVVAATPNVTGSCGSGTITAVAGSGTITLAGGTLTASPAAGSSCTFSVDATGTTAGVKNNTVQVSSTEGGIGNASNASLTVVAPPTISKAFGAASIPLNGTTSLTFTVTNPNTGTTLTGIAFSDTVPANLKMIGFGSAGDTCNGTTSPGSSTVNYSATTVAANSSCTYSVTVKGIAAGDAVNTTSTITSTEGGTGATSNTAVLTVVAPPSIAKVFNPNTIALNATTSLTFTITNPAANTVALTGVAFTDTLPTGLTVANASATVCGGTLTTTNPTGIALTGATIAVNSQCQFSVTVTGAASGLYTNTTGNVTSTNGGTGNTATANLTVASPSSITKLFGAAQIPLNGTTSLTFNITNPNTNVTLTGLAFTDNLPAGLVVASTPNLSNTCGGTATAVGGSGSVSLSAGTLAASASCTVSVDVQGTTAGVKNNSVQVTSTEGGTGNTSNASITVVAPPVIIKAFGAASIPLNGTTSLTFTIQNNNTTTTLTGVGFSDTLPAGLVISTPNGLVGSCGGGTITATQGTNVISLSGASIVASSSCTFAVNVTGIAAGLQNNTTGNVTSTEGGAGGTASASVKVEAPPSIAKVFNPSTIALNATTSLTFTITNPAANVDPLTGVAFTDTLPTGLTVANASATVCGGTLTTTAPTGIALSGATINSNSQCQFSVTVTGAASGQYTNTTGNVTSTNGGTGNTASANLTVASPPSISKAFGAAQIPLNGTTSLTFSITNPNTNVALTGVAFTDNLPAGLVVATPNGLSNTCGGTATAVAGSGSVSLSAGTLATSASCTVSVNVQGTTAGVKNNSVQVTSTEGGTGNTANASIAVVAPPVIIKAFGAASIPLNGSTSLTFTIQNNNTTTTLNGVGFSDTLPAGLVISTPNGLTGSCGGGTITATQNTNVISLSGASIAASSSCTFAVNVTGIAAGLQNNTTGNVTSTEGGTGGTASASIAVEAPPSIAKVFNPSTIALNATTSLTFTITNPAANVNPLTGVAFTDTLPTGLTVANASATVCGGTLTTTAPTGIALSGATINTNSQCQFSVTVTGAASGQYTNTTGNVTSTNGGTGNTASANLTVANPPTISKAFGAASIVLNATTSLTFTINNPNTTLALTGVAFTDNLPAGLVVATPNGLSNTCGGAVTATAGSNSVSLAGGTLAASGSCTISVNVQGTTAGAKANTTGPISSTQSGPGATSNTANITVIAPPSITKAFGAASINVNVTTSLTFTITNPNTGTALTGVAFTDTLPAGLVVATPNGLTGSCGGGTITAAAGSGSVSLTGATLAASSSCNFSVNVTSIGGGVQVNTTGNVTSTNGGTGNAATASITINNFITITPGISSATVKRGQSATFTFTVNASVPGTISLLCSGLPQGAACTFNPTNPSSTGTTAETLTVGTTAPPGQAMNQQQLPLGQAPVYVAMVMTLPVFGLLFVGIRNGSNKKQRKAARLVILGVLILIALLALAGCGGHPKGEDNSHPTPPGTYQITVTATNGTTSAQTTVTLTVTP